MGIGTHLDLGLRRRGQLQRSFLLLLGVMEMARMCQRGASACVLWIKPQLGSKFPFGLSCPSPGKAGEKTPKPPTLPYFAAAGQLGLQTLGATPLSCCRGENPAETPAKALRGPCAGAGSATWDRAREGARGERSPSGLRPPGRPGPLPAAAPGLTRGGGCGGDTHTQTPPRTHAERHPRPGPPHAARPARPRRTTTPGEPRAARQRPRRAGPGPAGLGRDGPGRAGTGGAGLHRDGPGCTGPGSAPPPCR